ncbi:hypothetical protein Q8A73_015326 [Channa argus]|nr:hypothetical protein Q8A73_015326 [Channa argus]
MQDARQTSKRVEARRREEKMASLLSWQGKDYDWGIMLGQLGLKVRKRGQQLAHGDHRWSLWMGNGETWSNISDRIVDKTLSISYTYSVMSQTVPVLLVQLVGHVY